MHGNLFGNIMSSDRTPRNNPLARWGRATLCAAGLLMFCVVAPAAAKGLPAEVVKWIRDDLGAPLQGTRYLSATADLNGDRRPELILHLVGPMVCGTGGCPTAVFAPQGEGYRLVSSISVTRPPIRESASSNNGWRNLIVHIAGGGGPSKDVELLFDGRSYPENPTVMGPYLRGARAAGSRILIPDFNAFEDAKPLSSGTDASGSARGPAARPSFDCAKAVLAAEKLVCGDPGLARADRSLARTFANGMKQWSAADRARERDAQRNWLEERNNCAKSRDGVRECLRASYQRRLIELQIRNGELEAPSPVSYRCKGDKGEPLLVSFYGQTDPPSAVLTFRGRQQILFVARSGSGARYTNAHVEFWEHHGEAAVTWSGQSYTCQAR